MARITAVPYFHTGEPMQTDAIRELSRRELSADRTVHILGLTIGVAGSATLILTTAIEAHWTAFLTVLVYTAGLLAMLSFSAAYNLGQQSRHRRFLRRLDHAAIFAMIAGTYTPFTILALDDGWRIGMTVVVWGLASIGIAVKLFAPTQRSTRISAFLYLALGWIGVVALGPFLRNLSPLVLILLGIGGGLYSFGVVFHALERLPYQNAIWHAFVLAAAIVHFAAVYSVVTVADLPA